MASRQPIQTSAAEREYSHNQLLPKTSTGLLTFSPRGSTSRVTRQGVFGTDQLDALAIVPPSPSEDFLHSASARGVSEFNMLIELDAPHTFEFAASFSGSVFVGTPMFQSLAILSQPGKDIFRFPAMPPGSVLATGVIPAGISLFRVQEDIQATAETQGQMVSGRGSYTFRLELTDVAPIPEPASLVLLGSGLLGLIGIRRRTLTTSLR